MEIHFNLNHWLFSLFCICPAIGLSQSPLIGKIEDANNNEPLISANIGLKHHPVGTYSNQQGDFQLEVPVEFMDDTLFVSYVGYEPAFVPLRAFERGKIITLHESPMLLDEVTILAKRLYRFEIKKIEGSMKLVKGKLFAGRPK